MDANRNNLDAVARVKIFGVGFAVYLASFGVALALDSAALIPKSIQGVVFVIYAPLIYPFMFVFGK